MKLSLSLTSGIIGLVPQEQKRFWCLLYVPGAIARFAGSISLAKFDNTGKMWAVSGSFIGAAFILFFGSLITYTLVWGKDYTGRFREDAITLFGYPLMVPEVLGALYSDWVLALAVDNLSGYPTDDSRKVRALWWLYMIGKRLNLLMI